MQELDAQRRLAILRGEAPPPLIEETQDEPTESQHASRDGGPDRHGSSRRKRKRYGEDDTDFELRLAKERAESGNKSLEVAQQPTSSAPIVDRRGHIDLFGDEKTRAHAEKNEEAERESRKKKREYEDQYTMRFSNAAGKHGSNRPWYSQADAAVQQEAPLKDVWGNDDPRRKERDSNRIVANDPLAMMKKGASRVRELKQERKKFQEEREEELRQMRKEDRRREKYRRREEREPRRRSDSPPRSDRGRRPSRDGRDDKHDRDYDRGRRRQGDRERSRRRESRSRERDSRRRRHD